MTKDVNEQTDKSTIEAAPPSIPQRQMAPRADKAAAAERVSANTAMPLKLKTMDDIRADINKTSDIPQVYQKPHRPRVLPADNRHARSVRDRNVSLGLENNKVAQHRTNIEAPESRKKMSLGSSLIKKVRKAFGREKKKAGIVKVEQRDRQAEQEQVLHHQNEQPHGPAVPALHHDRVEEAGKDPAPVAQSEASNKARGPSSPSLEPSNSHNGRGYAKQAFDTPTSSPVSSVDAVWTPKTGSQGQSARDSMSSSVSSTVSLRFVNGSSARPASVIKPSPKQRPGDGARLAVAQERDRLGDLLYASRASSSSTPTSPRQQQNNEFSVKPTDRVTVSTDQGSSARRPSRSARDGGNSAVAPSRIPKPVAKKLASNNPYRDAAVVRGHWASADSIRVGDTSPTTSTDTLIAFLTPPETRGNSSSTEDALEAQWLRARLEEEASMEEARRLQEQFDDEQRSQEAAWELWKKDNIMECVCCGDEQHRDDLVMPCATKDNEEGESRKAKKNKQALPEHGYCDDCLVAGFTNAVKNREPFKCCGKNLTPKGTDVMNLDADTTLAYDMMLLEMSTKDPVYCASPTCAAFILPEHIEGDIATCRAGASKATKKGGCRHRTCRHCRKTAHPGRFCKEDQATEAVKQLAQKEGWKTCPGCKHMVERINGCLHIVCTRCNTAFCYRCGKDWNLCASECPDGE